MTSDSRTFIVFVLCVFTLTGFSMLTTYPLYWYDAQLVRPIKKMKKG